MSCDSFNKQKQTHYHLSIEMKRCAKLRWTANVAECFVNVYIIKT